MRGGKNIRNRWTLFIFLLAGMVLGSFIGYYLRGYDVWAWLDYGQTFGLTNPVTLSLGVVSLTIGFVIKISMGSVIGMILGYAAYRFAER